MAKISVKSGTTSLTVNLFIMDSASTTGAGKTGLAYNTASLTAYYCLAGAAAAAITLATQTVTGAWSSGGFVEIDATNMPGWYRLDVPNAAIASGRFSSIHLKGASGMAPLPLEIELTAVDNSDSVRGGLTALPNVNSGSAGAIITSGTGTAQLSVSGGVGQADVAKWLGTGASTPTVAGVPNVNCKTWNDLATVALPLVPTVAGRTLDVSAGGEAGIDWANVGSPTTVVGLSGTTVGTVTLVTTTTTVTNQLTAAQIATGVWQDSTAGDFTAASSIGKSLYTAGVVPGGSGGLFISGSNTGTTTFGALTVTGATTFTGAMSGTFPTVTAVGTLTTYTGNTPQTGDSFARLGAPAGASHAADVAAVKVDTAAILVDTGTTLDGRIPAALVGGRMDCNVGAIDGETTSADRLAESTKSIAKVVVGVGSTTTSIVTSSIDPSASVSNQFAGQLLMFSADTTTVALRNQKQAITASSAGGVLTCNAFTTAPANTDTATIC